MADQQKGLGEVVGNVGHSDPDTGNPIKIGHKALAHGANPTAVAAADRSDSYANRHGVPWVIGGHPNVVTRMARVLDADGAQTDTALVTIGGGVKVVVTRMSVLASNANTVDVAFRAGFAAATLPALPGTTGTDDFLIAHPNIAPGSGVVEGNGSGILGVGADGEDLRYTCDDPVSGELWILVSYYTIES